MSHVSAHAITTREPRLMTKVEESKYLKVTARTPSTAKVRLQLSHGKNIDLSQQPQPQRHVSPKR
jgi:hypothetical protein